MEFLRDILLLVAGGIVTLVLGRLPRIRSCAWASLQRVAKAINNTRKFLIGKRSTRIKRRADFMSRRHNASSALLEATLFRWFEKDIKLLPFMLSVYANHKNELVRASVANLLWEDKPATALQVGDVVDHPSGPSSHILYIVSDDENLNDDEVGILWHATPNERTIGTIAQQTQIRVTRRGWCPLGNCRYCEMSLAQVREIGQWWWEYQVWRREANRLKSGGKTQMVASDDDAKALFEDLNDNRSIAKQGARIFESPDDCDYSPILSAQTIGDLKRLASEGWTFEALICEDYDKLPKVIISRWCPPRPPLQNAEV